MRLYKEPWMADLKTGDHVRRKPEHRSEPWIWDDEPMTVSVIHDDGTLSFAGCGDGKWQHYKFYPVQREWATGHALTLSPL